jgi:DNA-binding response OmpR family regulator
MRTSVKVLVIDTSDNRRLAAGVEHLALAGHQTVTANSELGARRRLVDEQADVVVLGEVNSPPRTLALLRELRAGEIHDADPQTKVVSFGADNDTTAVLHYQAGANLVLPSTSSPRLLTAAVETVGGLTQAAASPTLRVGSLTLDVHGLQAHSGQQTVSLTRRERDLLACLSRAPNKTFSRTEISREVYGSDLMAYNSRTIDSHMNRARDKLGQIGEAQRLQSVWGIGYRIER